MSHGVKVSTTNRLLGDAIEQAKRQGAETALVVSGGAE